MRDALGSSLRSQARPQRCVSQRQAVIAVPAACVLQATLRLGGWDDCASSGVNNSKCGRVSN
eukprot:8350156-Pyramimonas_sp.AAC.1